MAVHRYILLASPSVEFAGVLGDLLRQAGVSVPLLTATGDGEALTAVNDPHREPPVAVFVDVAEFPDPLRFIGWVVSSPTTRLIPVFAIVGSKGPQASAVEDYKPTAIVSHPLDLQSVARCVALSPLLCGSMKPDKPPPPAGPSPNSPPFSILIAL